MGNGSEHCADKLFLVACSCTGSRSDGDSRENGELISEAVRTGIDSRRLDEWCPRLGRSNS